MTNRATRAEEDAKRAAADATSRPEAVDAAADRAAAAYWRLWRRNFKPPFAAGDAPGPMRADPGAEAGRR